MHSSRKALAFIRLFRLTQPLEVGKAGILCKIKSRLSWFSRIRQLWVENSLREVRGILEAVRCPE